MRRILHSSALLLFLAPALPAQLATPKIVKLPSGVVQVTNTGPSKWVGTTGWHWVHEITIAPAIGSPGELDDIVSLALGDDGAVYVAQRKAPFIKSFGPDGKYRATFGRDGAGPGEFQSAMLGIKGDTLVVQDHAQRRVTMMLTSGKLLQTVASACCRLSSGFVVDNAGVAWIQGPIPRAGSGWTRVKLDGSALSPVMIPGQEAAGAKPASWSASIMTAGVENVVSFPIPLQPGTISAVRPDGNILVANTAHAMFTVLSPAGDTVQKFTAPEATRSITAAEREAMTNSMIDHAPPPYQSELRRVAHASDIPDHYPPWSFFDVDREGNSWVMFSSANSHGWTVFDADGRMLGDVAFPPIKSSTASTRSKDRIAYLSESADGEQIVEVFRLVKRGAGPR